MQTRRKFFVVFLFFSFLSAPAVLGEESAQESEKASAHEPVVLSLREIDRYINDSNKRDFQKALVELTRYLEKNPEQFDAVQRRYKKILGSKDRYSALANQLMQLIRDSSEEDSEEVDEKMMRLTDQILAIERNPGDPRLEIVKDTNYLVSIRQYSAIQNKTATLVQNENYTQAALKASEGFNILHENFEAKFQDEKNAAALNLQIEKIRQQIESFIQIQERIKLAENNYVQAIKSGNEAAVSSALSSLTAVFTEYSKIRNSVVDSGLEIEKTFEPLKKTARKTASKDEDKFLAHGIEYPMLAYGSVFGWSENPDPDHGVLGVMDAFFNVHVEYLKKVSVQTIEESAVHFADTSSVQAFRQSGVLPDKNELGKIGYLGNAALKVNGLYSLMKNKNGKGTLSSYPEYNLSVDYIIKVAEHTGHLVDDVLKIDGIKSRSYIIQTPSEFAEYELAGGTYVEDLLWVADEIESVIKTVNENSTENSSWSEEYRSHLEKKLGRIADAEKKSLRTTSGLEIHDDLIEWKKITGTYTDYISAADDYAKDSVAALYKRCAQYYSSCGKEFVQNVQNNSDKLQGLIDGTMTDGMLRKYSRKAGREGKTISEYIIKAKTSLAVGREKVSGKYEASYPEEINRINESIAQLEALSSGNNEKIAFSGELVQKADSNISEAEKKYSSAQKAFRQKKFDDSRKYANEAMDFYNESLRFDYDEKLAVQSRSNIEKLLSDIAEQQKILIDQEVNALIAQANKEFNNDNYTQAQSILNQAEERWNVVFIDYENTEISNMQKIVENALNANNGREVLPADSLYLDVSQMLRNVSQSFDKGKNLTKKGRKDEGEVCFNEALQTLEILRSLVPRNMAANKLRLEIQQFQDPEQFEINFASRVSKARDEAKDASKGTVDTEKLLQAYSDLCDLAEIKSDYPGLQSTIIELEYTLGKRTRPADQKAKAQARAYYQEAQKLFEAGKYQEAFQKINLAISKDSSDQNFKKMRSRISPHLKTKVYTRDANYSDRYQEVVELISSNRYEMALGIITDLWKNPANRTENLEKLKNRVERALGT